MSLVRRLATQSSVIFAARLFGAGVIFVTQAAMARLWGAEYLGEFLLIVAAVNLIAVVMPLGFETIGTYFAAEYRAKGEGRLLRGFMARAYLHVGLLAAALLLVGPLFIGLLGEPGRVLGLYWLPACLCATAMALIFVNASLLVGLKRPYAGFFADGVFRPLLVLLALVIALPFGPAEGAFGIMIWTLGVGSLAIATGQLVLALRAVRAVPDAETGSRSDARRWWRFALPWVLIALATDYFFDIDLLVLSHLLSREELAIFGVCTRVFSLVAFGVAAVYAVTLPDMFESEALHDRAGFERKVGEANLIATLLSVALFAGVALGAPLLLMLFGPAFAAGAAPLAVLCLALVVRSGFGPAAMVLSVRDRPYATLPSIALGMVVLIGANLLLVPGFGLMGGAVAALIAMTVWSAAMWLTALKLTGIDVSILPRVLGLVAKPRTARE